MTTGDPSVRSAARILVVGESLVEFVRTDRTAAGLAAGSFLGPFPSGAPAIFASAAALAGVDVSFVSTVGADPFGRLVVERLAGDGVDVSGVREVPNAVTGTAFVAYDLGGGREFVFHVADAAPGRITIEDLGTRPEEAGWIHVSGASLSLSPALAAVIVEAVERVRRAGGRVSLDPNLRPGSFGIAGPPVELRRLLDVADVVFPGLGELAALGTDAASVAARGAIVCETSGPNGVTLFQRGQTEHLPGVPTAEADPTGAGDTFAGVFLATLIATGEARRAAERANAAASGHVAVIGPMERRPGWL